MKYSATKNLDAKNIKINNYNIYFHQKFILLLQLCKYYFRRLTPILHNCILLQNDSQVFLSLLSYNYET